MPPCDVWENFMLRQLGLRKTVSYARVCVSMCVCVRHFVYLHNKQSESQNKIIDARIFGGDHQQQVNGKRPRAKGTTESKERGRERAGGSPEPKLKLLKSKFTKKQP